MVWPLFRHQDIVWLGEPSLVTELLDPIHGGLDLLSLLYGSSGFLVVFIEALKLIQFEENTSDMETVLYLNQFLLDSVGVQPQSRGQPQELGYLHFVQSRFFRSVRHPGHKI